MASISRPLAITLPDGQEASFEEMQTYGRILQDFIRDQEARLPEVGDTNLHNEIIDYLQLLATAYNKQLRIYKAREEQKQRQFMVLLMQVGGN
jgi:hypothetical protein